MNDNSVPNGSGTGTASFNPRKSLSDWEIFDQVLEEKDIPRQIVIYPFRYLDQYNVTRRKGAIKEMGKRGLTATQLEAILPFKLRYIYDILGETNGVSPTAGKEASTNFVNNRTDGA